MVTGWHFFPCQLCFHNFRDLNGRTVWWFERFNHSSHGVMKSADSFLWRLMKWDFCFLPAPSPAHASFVCFLLTHERGAHGHSGSGEGGWEHGSVHFNEPVELLLCSCQRAAITGTCNINNAPLCALLD